MSRRALDGAAFGRLGALAPIVLVVALCAVPSSVTSARVGIAPPAQAIHGVAVATEAGVLAEANRSLALGHGPKVALSPLGRWNQTRAVVSDDPAMAYDPADRFVLLFEGLASSTLNSTWTYRAGNWTQLHVARAPQARFGESLVYDAADAEFVLFGGGWSAPNYYTNDTWTFRAGAWSELNGSATGAPAGRAYVSLTYDDARKAVILFGGTNASEGTPNGTVFQDTWQFSAGHWVPIPTAVSPSRRYDASFAYDPATRSDLLIGGLYERYFPNVTIVRNTSWTFHNGTWRQVGWSTEPTPRVGASLVPAPGGSPMVLFGGSPFGVPSYGDRWNLNDTWELSNGSWSVLLGPSPPTSDGGLPLVEGPTNGSLLLFGSPPWSFRAGSWQLAGPRPLPPPSSAPLLTYDAKDRYVLLLASSWNDGVVGGAAQTWSFQAGVWTNLTPLQTVNPPAGTTPTMTFDAADGYVVLFGGAENSTWTFAAGVWNRLNTTLAPSARYGSEIVYDAADGYAVLFGGSQCFPGYWWDECVWLNDTWGFAGGAWFPITPRSGVAPPGRNFESLAFDAADGDVVMFGGYWCPNANYCPAMNDTWSFKAGGWEELPNGTSPSPRLESAVAYDPGNNSVVLVGGSPIDSGGGVGLPQNGTWAFANGTWSLLNFPGQFVPQPTVRAAIAFVPELEEMLLVEPSGEIWTLQLGPAGSLPLQATVSSTAASGDDPLTVGFLAAASGGIGPYTYAWNFSDGTTGVGPDPTHVFDRTGSFEVAMVAFDATGRSAQRNVTIDVDPYPAVRGNATPLAGAGPLVVEFRGAISGGAAPFQIEWSFGDGGNASSLNVTHTYGSPGTFVVALTAVDRFGAVARDGPWVVQVSAPAPPLSASLHLDPLVPILNGTLRLSVSVDGGSSPFAYNWTGLPPGCLPVAASNVTCRPTAIGEYSPTVVVRDGAGATTYATASVVVVPPTLHLTAWATPALVSLGGMVDLEARYAGGVAPLGLVWSGLPPGCVDHGLPSVRCVPSAVGSYLVQAVVSDSANQSSAANLTVEVIAAPPASSPPTGYPLGLSPFEALGLGLLAGAGSALGAAWVVFARKKQTS